MTMRSFEIAASLLSSDFSCLGSQVQAVTHAGIDRIHLDIMDGHFVPALTMGPDIIKAIRPYSNLPFDVHLMVESPDLMIDQFAKIGVDSIIIHPEADPHPHRHLQKIRSYGIKAGLALNPSTSPHIIDYLLDEIDIVLIMTVNPGAGGQNFIFSQLQKIEFVYQKIISRSIRLAVDGGINTLTAPQAIQVGADMLIAGTAIFKNNTLQKNISILKQSCHSPPLH